MPIQFGIPGSPANGNKFSGLWDTGASGTVINQNVVDALGLTPTGKIPVNTASATGVLTDTFIIDVWLKIDVCIQGITVTLGKLSGIDCLIGMDIITLGDFSISNHKGDTCLSFRVPSQHHQDFVQDFNNKNKIPFGKSLTNRKYR